MVATNTEVSPRRQRWEDITQTPLLIGSALFLFAYSILILVPELGTLWRVAVILTLSVVWAAFIVDLIVRVTLTARGHRFEFMRKHPAETASAVIPWVFEQGRCRPGAGGTRSGGRWHECRGR